MKVSDILEVLDDKDILQTDLKTNKGKAVAAIVRGAKRKSNGRNDHEDVRPEIEVVPE